MELKRFLSKVLTLFPITIRLTILYRGGLKSKIQYYRFARLAKEKGVISFRIDRVARDYVRAKHKSKIDKSNADFLIAHGINPSRANMAGINRSNVNEFISEFDFYNIVNYHGIDLSQMFDNKLMTYFVLNKFQDFIPAHFYYISKTNGVQSFYKLTNINEPNNISPILFIKSLLEDSAIALKRCYGGHGDGFIKLSKIGDNYLINDVVSEEIEVDKKIGDLDNYIVTSFVKPHKELRDICGENSFAVLRVITLYSTTKRCAEIAGIIIRLGTQKSGATQAFHDHMYVGVNMEDGSLYNPIYEVDDYNYYHTDFHPDTNKRITGYKLPNLNLLKETVIQIANYLSMTPYLVFDIIPTDDSFSILEINSHGQPFIVEPYYRLKLHPEFKNLFKLS